MAAVRLDLRFAFLTDAFSSICAVMTSPSKEPGSRSVQNFGVDGIGALRYPSGVPETFPHKGEVHEDVYAVGMNPHTKGGRLNFRFKEKDTLRDPKGCNHSSRIVCRPQVTCLCMSVLNHWLQRRRVKLFKPIREDPVTGVLCPCSLPIPSCPAMT